VGVDLPEHHPARPRPVDLLPADHPLKPRPPRGRWRYSPGVRFLAFTATAAAVVAGFLALTLLPVVGAAAPRSWMFLSLAQLTAAIVGYAVLLLVESRRPVELSPRRLAGLGWGLLLGTGLCVTVILILAAVGSYRVMGTNPDYPIVPALVTTGLTASITEELFFRGVLFRLSEDLLGTWAAVGISALVFGSAHLANPQASLWGAIAIALEAGVLFGALYAVTRSLWWCMGLHLAWNMLQGPVFGSAVSGSGSASGLLRAEFPGPDWLTGGQFGIEASVVTVTLLTIVGCYLLSVVHREKLAVRPTWARRRVLQATRAAEGSAAAGAAAVADRHPG